MYDVNPLGPMMHLKELDRQAALRLRSPRNKRQDGSSPTAVSWSIFAYLQRLFAVHFLWRVARTSSYQSSPLGPELAP